MPSPRAPAERVVVIEQLGPWEAAARWYLARGFEVWFLAPGSAPPERRALARAAAAGRLRHLRLPDPLYVGIDPSADLAYEHVERLGERNPRWGSASARRLERLYAGGDLSPAFKKHLLGELAQHFHCRLNREQIDRVFPSPRTLLFIPASSEQAALCSRYDKALGLKPPRAGFPPWVRILGWASLRLRDLRSCALVAYVMARAALDRVLRAQPAREPEPVDYALALSAPWREENNLHRRPTFLVDGESLRKDNVVLAPLAPLGAAYAASLDAQGFRVAPERPSAPPGLWLDLWRHGLPLLAGMLVNPGWMTPAAASLFKTYWLWRAFLARWRPRRFVTYADFHLQQIGRNLLLRSTGTETWYYIDSENHAAMYFGRPGRPAVRDAIWGYLSYDHVVCWTESLASFFAAHRQNVGVYHAVGCVWSQAVCELRASGKAKTLRRKIGGAKLDLRHKLVAIFDSSYVNLARSTYEDGAAYAGAILRLIEDLPEIFVVWKEKKPRSMHPPRDSFGLVELYAQLAAHPRCRFLPHDAPSEEIIAAADLTISFPFTSTTVEALGARAKGIFYAPSEKFRGTYFDEVPGLTAYGRETLRDLVRRLLSGEEDEAFWRGIEAHKDTLDAYMDGRGLSRFRALLRGEQDYV